MEVFARLALLLLFFITNTECRDIWDIFGPSYPELSNIELTKGKPIRLRHNYTQLQIGDVRGTLYSDSLSQLSPVTDLKIFWHQIRDIEDGAICSLPTLKIFELNCMRDSRMPTLTKSMLRNCDNLEELHILGNLLYRVNMTTDAFDNLTNLKVLHLRNFDLEHLRRDYFKGLQSLTNLTLVDCNIQVIDSNVFDEMENLEEAQIAFNHLSRLPTNLFVKTPKMTKLVLYANHIQELSWSEFNGLSSLKELDLKGNRIKAFDGKTVSRYMPDLRLLRVELMVKDCKEEKTKLKHWAKSKPHLWFVYTLRSVFDSSIICDDSEER